MREEPTKGKGARRPLQIGKYEVLSRIAVGGMGSVYKAVDKELGRVVALKVLPPAMANKPAMIERFRREARSAAKLRHENIVILYDFCEDRGTFYLVMEYVEGTDLQEYIDRKGVLDVDEAVTILRQALRALEHAHHEGIVHRDIKPSNFMLTRRGEEFLVKLTDMGLARHEDEQDTGPLDRSLPNQKGNDTNRLTQAGTTVGTVDYMSPEQAQNSAMADIRSDLYSLGCTLYHMLTGQPPFPTGSSSERLYKHIDEEPADVCSLNERVPPELARVLKRLMAKNPTDRFQTPVAVLEALDNVGQKDDEALPARFDFEQRDVLAELARGQAQPPTVDEGRPRSRGPRKRPDSEPVRRNPVPTQPRPDSAPTVRVGARTRPPSKTKQPAPPASRQWLIVIGIGAVVVIAAAVVLGSSGGGRSRSESTESKESPRAQRLPEQTTTPPTRPAPEKTEIPAPRVITWPALFTPATPIDSAAMRQKFEAPWASEPPLDPSLPTTAVSRSFTGGDGNGHFGTLSAAAASVSEKPGTTIYDFQDPGPLFEPGVAWSDRNVVLRGLAGQRTLLVWDSSLGKDHRTAFLTVARGNLTLENLDIVLRWHDSEAADPTALLHLFDGDLTARNCTFFISGKFKNGVTLARLDGTKSGCRCRLQHCFARGGQLLALDLKTPGVEALLEDSLVAGGDQPLVQVLGRNQPGTTIRTARSTLIGGHSFLTVKPASASDTAPAVAWEGWDTLLARSHEVVGGNLIEFLDNSEASRLKWHGINCLYAGWKTLLHARESIPATDFDRWREQVQGEDGDRAIKETWPLVVRHDTAELPPSEYEIAPDSPVAFAATPEAGSAPRPLGCPLATLPPGRSLWVTRLFERSLVPPMPTSERPPPDLELNNRQIADLGVFLQEYQRKVRLGPKLVVQLTGSGDWYTSPIQLKGTSLVLRGDEPRPGDPAPLALVARAGSAGDLNALITVEGGDLELDGVEIRMPGPRGIPPYLIQVTGGNLLVRGSRLTGALAQAPGGYRGLITWTGSGEEAPDRARTCLIQDSLLLSGRNAIEVKGGGARLHFEQSLVMAGAEALRFEPEGAKPRVNVRLTLDHATVAARQALLAVADAPQLGSAQEPILIQPAASAFLVPIEPGKAPPQATLLRAEGNALGRGLVLWQGDGNFYDQRLHAYVRAAETTRPDQQQDSALWLHLWGTLPARGTYNRSPGATFNPVDPKLDRFSLLGMSLPRPVPGVDLTRLVFRRLRSPI